MSKYVIIHGHFYQPPRENPWTGRIERQSSAAPYHDWNERVYDECYRPNAYSRLLDGRGRITDINNNYCSMSFNFGPTLFSWIEEHHGGTARRIIEADAVSCRTLGGHGNAIAQVYNHIIMPLSSVRDQLTQIRWAKRHFRERFGRDPEGLWLAETAINMETVRCCIAENIRFVILSPSQAEAIRQLGSAAPWNSLHRGIDTGRAYRILPVDCAGNRMAGYLDALFFDAAVSREASFGNLLTDANLLGARINDALNHNDHGAVILATDGETFGHHKPFGDMCLSAFFKKVAPELGITPVNFGWFLEHHPPRHEVMLRDAYGEGSSWSCSHGVGRWARDCGCAIGGEQGWKQTWRTPLRSALTKLKAHVDREYETAIEALGMDPWALRDDYIGVAEEFSPHLFEKICGSHIVRQAAGSGLVRSNAQSVRNLLEAQKNMMFAFTSCGWFFSDIGGIETVQNLGYAARALQLGIPAARRQAVLQEFLEALGHAKGNRQGETGRTIFESHLLRYFDGEAAFPSVNTATKTVLPATGLVSRISSLLKSLFRGPEPIDCVSKWRKCIRQLERRVDPAKVKERLRAIANKQEQRVDLQEDAKYLERIIRAELAALSETISAKGCERMRHLLDIVDAFRIPVSKSRLEDIFHHILTGPAKSLSKNDGLYHALADLAARMNFAPDALNTEQRQH